MTVNNKATENYSSDGAIFFIQEGDGEIDYTVRPMSEEVRTYLLENNRIDPLPLVTAKAKPILHDQEIL